MAAVSRFPPAARATARIVVAVAIVAATVAVVGTGPLLHGIATVSPVTIVIACALAAVATGAAAWRWRVVAARLGMRLTWRSAFAAYYRSQFLNTVLPGGILGDVHRAYAHGRDTGQVGVAARAVAAERAAGQVVQIVLTVAVLLPLGLVSSLAPLAWAGAALLAVVAVVAGAMAATARGRRLLHRELRMLRPLCTSPRAVVAIAVSSAVVVAAHTATFVVAGLAAGVGAGAQSLGAVALIVLGASAVPVNVGGWGPREAVSASAFALIGLGASAGVMVSAAFGVLTMIAVFPGALMLAGERVRSRRDRARAAGSADRAVGPRPQPCTAREGSAA